jgi:hypothetical protein
LTEKAAKTKDTTKDIKAKAIAKDPIPAKKYDKDIKPTDITKDGSPKDGSPNEGSLKDVKEEDLTNIIKNCEIVPLKNTSME